MNARAGGPPPDGADRTALPFVLAALAVLGLLAGGAWILATRGDGTSAVPSAPAPSLPSAQLDGPYAVTIVVRSAANLASIHGIPRPVPGSSRIATWRFYRTCDPSATPCPASWRGRGDPLTPQGAVWSGTVSGPGVCFDGARAEATIGLRLTVREAGFVADEWVARSFTGVSSVRFHCPGFAPSRGVVDVTGVRR